ncbi:MAG: VanW family protein [Patescibacteria group bacterium]|nr:VanW family protein [Patescibacteria group bacterium]MDP6756409.1 VanW family protein [Patescibacteria group bacterium]
MSKKSKNKKNKLWKNWHQRFIIIIIAAAVLVFALGKGYTLAYDDEIYAGVFVGSFSLGGFSKVEATQTIESSIDVLHQNGLEFVFRDRNVNVPTVVAATEDPDLSYELISYDIDETLSKAFEYGRSNSFFEQWQDRIFGLIGRSAIAPSYTWREGSIRDLLKENLATLEYPAKDAELVIKNAKAQISQEKEGIVFDYDRAISEAKEQLSNLIFTPIPLKLEKDIPRITSEQASPLIEQAQQALRTQGIRINHEEQSWFWPSSRVNSLLEIRLGESGSPEVGYSKIKLKELLLPITNRLNIEPQEPRFALEDGKVVEFKTSTNGQRLVFEDTWSSWEQKLLEEDITELEPIVVVVEPNQSIADVNDFGITELLGVGKSNFAGSPANRRHNIRIGAEAVNGTIIPPDEEFSLLATLGTIDGSTGYLQELVIKGNETIPEYGGGLCQIGTTTFRGTLEAGLKVTARHNHSYSVPYYYDSQGKPGTDATIYDPAPDYRFKNDTQNHILITTRIEGDNLYFEYWGTKDGRKVVQSETRTWDHVPPPETKYVETLDLPVGETKCTESPHAGIKAEFDYTVTYSDGTVNEETFKSQYRPWQEVCLIGVEELSPEAEEGLELDGADLIDATI